MVKIQTVQISMQRDLGSQIMAVSGGSAGQEAGTPDFREQMILHNRIAGLLEFKVAREDDRRIFEYEIENKISFAERFKARKPDCKTLTSYLKNLLEIIYRGREYMLLEDDYIISPDSVFTDDEGNIFLAYYPGYGEDLKEQLRGLAEYLMDKIDYDDESAVLMIYGFYMKTKESGCAFEDLIKCLNEEHRKTDPRLSVSQAIPAGPVIPAGLIYSGQTADSGTPAPVATPAHAELMPVSESRDIMRAHTEPAEMR
ncbi:MAG: hypothetical protein IK071_08040, partial [Lachnospiraceae bacterium]|nr:hypothetical protein [Lachnospiraceae bacterium]